MGNNLKDKIEKIEFQILQQEEIVKKATEKLEKLQGQRDELYGQRDREFANSIIQLANDNKFVSYDEREDLMKKFAEFLQESKKQNEQVIESENRQATADEQVQVFNTEELGELDLKI